ncbi:hypothetical protein ACHAXA_007712 [Cyclostephanos tholiformis]|uniref:Late endosomal/lysosomal adaptor and MAPK and MTOR activator 4 n=1 Tax=Cyclostephanos tholiformis TaxID=382380 RepID=A0ABD3RY54_9STRA
MMSDPTSPQPATSAAMTNGFPPPPLPPPSSIVNDDDDDDAVELDLDAVPGQIGHAVLRATDGAMMRGPSGCLTERDVQVAYRMMLEIGTLLSGDDGGRGEEGGLRRVTVGFRGVTYAITLGEMDGCLYVVKRRSSP